MEFANTLKKAHTILMLLAQEPGLTLTAISEKTSLPKTTAHRLLSTLLDLSYVVKGRGASYRLGPVIARLGEMYQENMELPPLVRPYLRRLRDLVKETVHLAVLEGPSIIYIDKAEGPQALRTHFQVGIRRPVHSTALGKALLAHQRPEEIKAILTEIRFDARTPYTITDPDAFRAELERVQAQGYALDDQENEDGVRCVAAPIFGPYTRAIAAISVTGPATRVHFPDLIPAVVRAATEVSDALGHDEQASLAADEEFRARA